MTRSSRVVGVLVVMALLAAAPALAQGPVAYRLTFPEPEHHWMQVEATFPDLGRTALHLQMSRSSPGRYALHEFAKNVFEIRAFDSRGIELQVTRLSPHEWSVSGHDGTVRVAYKIFGDRVDGTYLAVDSTHAHMNMPATLMWARGLEARGARVRIEPPDPAWKVATQLLPTPDALVFTAPNLQYLMDSPTEVGPVSIRSFFVANPDGRRFEIRTAVHHTGSEADVDDYAANVEKIVRVQQAIFGELPEFDGGTYTFLADYLPYASGDGMEHRNSTVLSSRANIADPQQRLGALGTVSHEFFHCWNVERIRPAGLEPFDFTRENMSDSLWLAEGFTSYYGPLAMARAGVSSLAQVVAGYGRTVDAVVNGSGRQFRSAAEMSRLAPFVDAASFVDRTNLQTTFVSYYTWGAAIALGLDLTLRDMSAGKIGLDDYMRALWRAHGRPGGPSPGLVAKPYTLRDARDRLAEVSGSRTFANEFFDKYIEGRETVDYTRLLAHAGLVLRPRNPGAAWIGRVGLNAQDGAVTITALVPPGSPAYAAGLEQDDVLKTLDGEPVGTPATVQNVLRRHKPGDAIKVEFLRRGTPVTASLTLGEDPALELVTLESTGGAITDAQKALREGWIGIR